MSTQIDNQATSAREAHRDPSGRFGNQPASEAHDVQLGEPAAAGPAEDGSAPGAVALKRVFPFQGSETYFRLGRISVGGQEYVTDRYAAIRNDYLTSPHSPGADNHLGTVTNFGAVPHDETVPVDPESRWGAATVGPLVKAGFEIRANPEPANAQEKSTHHVYNDGEHIGWVMSHRRLPSGVTKGVRFAQMQEAADSVKTGAPYSAWSAAHDRLETEVHD